MTRIRWNDFLLSRDRKGAVSSTAPLRSRLTLLAAHRGLFFFSAFALVSSIQAATPPRIVGESVRIGFPGAHKKGMSRNGVWTPLRLTLKAGEEDVSADSFRAIVETIDGEGVPYEYSAAVPAFSANSEQTLFVYARPGNDSCEFVLKLRNASGREAQPPIRVRRDANAASNEIIGIHDIFYLAVGSPLPGLESALGRPLAVIDDPVDLPDRWFGYEGVDAIVLTTSNDDFLTRFVDMDEARRGALLDWLRRGGRLILSVGRNRDKVAHWLERAPVVNVLFNDTIARQSVPNLQLWGVAEQQPKQALPPIEVVRTQPGADTYGLVWENAENGKEKIPLVLQSGFGLGRVVLIVFDVDAPPFSTWEGQSAIWKRLAGEITPRPASVRSAPWGQNGELATELKRGLENFEEVPIISFGWVALFILGYIVLVGPLDYLLLRKIFKRLELTWITFPLLALLVGAAAYATTRAVKGGDLRINKIDLVDIDLHGNGRVYGRTWLTLFSPHVATYTIGLLPAAPEWGGRWHDGAARTPVMTAAWSGSQAVSGGTAQSVFRHPYEYNDDASVLSRVPIPAWATRSFTASWQTPLKDGAGVEQPPLIQSRLRVSRSDDNVLFGSLTNNLPAELQKVALFYRGKWYVLGDLAPGESRDVNPLFEGNVKKRELAEWFDVHSEVLQPRSGLLATSQQRSWTNLMSSQTLRRLMFHDLPGGSSQPNSGLRCLDESWRLQLQGEGTQRRWRDEVILVARTPPRSDNAEVVTQDGISPSHLWLDEQTALPGYLQQETYVRIYIPLVRHN